MKISTKGQYGLRALVDLSINSSDRHVSLNSVAQRQNISLNYLEQVFASLRKAGLVKSVKGAQGGYVLAISPRDITVGMILRVLEGNISIISETKKASSSNDIDDFLNDNVWQKINLSIESLVNSLTLEQIASDYKKNLTKKELMFYI